MTKRINFVSEKRFEECTGVSQLRFDFYLEDYCLLIEHDGGHHIHEDHYHNSKSEGAFEKRRKYDLIKTKFAAQKGLSLLRTSYLELEHIEAILKEVLERLQKANSQGFHFNIIAIFDMDQEEHLAVHKMYTKHKEVYNSYITLRE